LVQAVWPQLFLTLLCEVLVVCVLLAVFAALAAKWTFARRK
jgi:hypothetical protein